MFIYFAAREWVLLSFVFDAPRQPSLCTLSSRLEARVFRAGMELIF